MFFRAGIWPENVPAAPSTPWNPPGTPWNPVPTKNEDSSIKIKRFDPNLFILMELSSFFGLHSRLCGLHRGLSGIRTEAKCAVGGGDPKITQKPAKSHEKAR